MFEQITLNLYPPFIEALDELSNKYGETFTKINALSKEQLNFTTFIDAFVDSDNVANASIDPNANTHNIDICSLDRVMAKPHQKIHSYNKIFYVHNHHTY